MTRAPGATRQSSVQSRRLSVNERLIVAMDFTALAPAVAMAERLRGVVRVLKVGSVLFTACGPEAVRRLRALGFEVMLDLKFFDIPNTVELSCRSATRLRVSRLTVHAQGGAEMLQAAVRGVREEAQRIRPALQRRPKVLAVTRLTSEPVPPTISTGEGPSRRIESGGSRAMWERVLGLAEAAREAGCDGVVASAQEAGRLRRSEIGRAHV